MPSNIENRDLIVSELRRELVGPDPRGHDLDCTQSITFSTAEESYGPWRQTETGEEILQRDPPSKRYGIGVLYPLESLAQDDAGQDVQIVKDNGADQQGGVDPGPEDEVLTQEARRNLEEIGQRAGSASSDIDADDLDLSSANTYRPSSMAVSFLGEMSDSSRLIIDTKGGRYRSLKVQIGGEEPRGSVQKRPTGVSSKPANGSGRNC